MIDVNLGNKNKTNDYPKDVDKPFHDTTTSTTMYVLFGFIIANASRNALAAARSLVRPLQIGEHTCKYSMTMYFSITWCDLKDLIKSYILRERESKECIISLANPLIEINSNLYRYSPFLQTSNQTQRDKYLEGWKQ